MWAAQAAVRAGLIDAVLAAASAIEDPTTKAGAYAGTAEAAARADQRPRVQAAIDAVLAAAAKITAPFAKAGACGGGRGGGRGGLIMSAEDALKQIPKGFFPAEHSTARSAVAQALAREGRFHDARVFSEDCRPLDKLRADTVIMTEYTKRSR